LPSLPQGKTKLAAKKKSKKALVFVYNIINISIRNPPMTQDDIEAFIDIIDLDVDYKNDKIFYRTIIKGANLLRITDEDFAHAFGVSRTTVTRWKKKINAPHPLARRVVYAWLKGRAYDYLKRAYRFS
jgi:hypothetical protein